MLSFQLFRARVFPPIQSSLFAERFEPNRVLIERIKQRPAAELRQGYTWHIGNISEIDTHGIYFALGRTTKSTLTLYDESSGNFVETEYPAAPYTHVVCDAKIELLGIARKPELAPTATGIARQLEKLLNSTSQNKSDAIFEIVPITDPTDFIESLRDSYSIESFAVTFGHPNPFDADEDFQKPMERYLRAAEGSKGKTRIAGPSLNSKTLETMTRSAAATGNDAEARLKSGPKAKSVKRRLRGDILAEEFDGELTSESERRQLLGRIRAVYNRIRGMGT